MPVLNKAYVNNAVNEARQKYKHAMQEYAYMSADQQSAFLRKGVFDKIQNDLMEKLGDKKYGVDLNAVKAKWGETFEEGRFKMQLATYKALMKQNEDKVGAYRAEARNNIIHNPYSTDLQDGSWERDLMESVDGIIFDKNAFESDMLYDKSYALAVGFYENKDLKNMERVLYSKEARKALGDDYEKLVRMKNRLRDSLNKKDKSGMKVSDMTGALGQFAKDFDTETMRIIARSAGFENFGNELNNIFYDFAKNYDSNGNAEIKLDSLSQYIPSEATPRQQQQLLVGAKEAAEKYQSLLREDPVQAIELINGQEDIAQRGSIQSRTGRRLTNQDASQLMDSLSNAFKSGIGNFTKEVNDIYSKHGERVGREIIGETFSFAEDLERYQESKGIIELMQMTLQEEKYGNFNIEEARQAVVAGHKIPNWLGDGIAAGHAFSNDELGRDTPLMRAMKRIAVHRVRKRDEYKEGRNTDGEQFKEDVYDELDSISGDYINFRNRQNRSHILGFAIKRSDAGLHGTQIGWPRAVGEQYDLQGHVQTEVRAERNTNINNFRAYSQKHPNFFSDQTNELLSAQEGTHVEATIENGKYKLWIREETGEDSSIVHEVTKSNGQPYEVPLAKIYENQGQLLYVNPGYGYSDERPAPLQPIPTPFGVEDVSEEAVDASGGVDPIVSEPTPQPAPTANPNQTEQGEDLEGGVMGTIKGLIGAGISSLGIASAEASGGNWSSGFSARVIPENRVRELSKKYKEGYVPGAVKAHADLKRNNALPILKNAVMDKKINKTGLPPEAMEAVVLRVLWSESLLNEKAVNEEERKAGKKNIGKGIAQMTAPSVMRKYGVTDPFNTKQSVDASVSYISDLYNDALKKAQRIKKRTGLRITKGHVMIAALKRYNGGTTYSGETTVRDTARGKISTGDPNVNNYVLKNMLFLTSLSKAQQLGGGRNGRGRMGRNALKQHIATLALVVGIDYKHIKKIFDEEI